MPFFTRPSLELVVSQKKHKDSLEKWLARKSRYPTSSDRNDRDLTIDSIKDSLLASDPGPKGRNVSSKVDASVPEWKDCLTKKDLLNAAIKRKEDLRKKHVAKFVADCLVSTRNKLVSSSIPKVKREDGKRNVRPKVFGVLIKKSELDPTMWLVKFHNNKCLYCSIKVLVFEAKEGNTNILTANEKQMLLTTKLNLLSEEHESILKTILYPLILKVPGHSNISIKSLVKKFKPKYPWIKESSLRNYVMLYQNKLSLITDKISD